MSTLRTRLLESRAVVRGAVSAARVREVGDTWVLLDTDDHTSSRHTRWPSAAGPDLPRQSSGMLRVDVVADDVIRVRYSPDGPLPEADPRLVIGSPAGPGTVSIEQDAQRLTLTLARHRVELGLESFALRILDGEREVVVAGGPPKNAWDAWDAYATGVCHSALDGQPVAVETFSLRPGEAIYGLGERFLGIDKVGQTLDVTMTEGLGTTTPRAYKNVPLLVSTHGYGVFFATTAQMTAWLGSLSAPDVQIGIEDGALDYYVLLGPPRTVLARYHDLTGRPALPPDWSFGFWQSKISYSSAAETLEVARRMRAANIPFDVLHLDTAWFRRDWWCDLEFSPDRFPDPAGWLAELRALGVRVCLWQLPYIPSGSALYDELLAVDGFVKTQDGEVYDTHLAYVTHDDGSISLHDDPDVVVGCIDMTRPEAVAVYQRWIRGLLELGVAAIKTDFGEQAPIDGVYADGTPGHLVHNLYPVLYQQAVAEITEQVTGEQIIWARAGWAGAHRYPVHWGGDSSSNWDNLGPQLAGGLSLGLSGFAFWSQDCGGFLGQPSGDLLVRWVQFSVLLSHVRIHGFGTRELYAFDGETGRLCADWVRFRYRLMPYLLASARQAVAQSVPMARALVFDFPDDPSTWPIADQWILGDALLVAPILDATGQRRVYLPEGTWRDWQTGAATTGPRWITVRASLAQVPIWVREGGIVPSGPDQQYVGQHPTDEFILKLAPWTRNGVTTLEVPTDAGLLPVTYRCVDGRHEIELGAPDVRVVLDVLGADPPDVAVIRAAE